MSEEVLDVTIAPDPDVAFWTRVNKEAIKRNEEMRHEIIINEAIIRLSEEKIGGKNGE